MKQRQHTDIYKKTRKQLEQENCALQTLAELDGLTGLYNRITMERRWTTICAGSSRNHDCSGPGPFNR